MDRQLLIADDDPVVCRTLKRYFARSRRVAIARTVEEATALIGTTPRWSGAIVDYHFPDGDGLAVLGAFRRVSRAPVLLLTGENTPQVIHRASELGAQFVVKPAPTTLLRAFAERLDERMAPMELEIEIERAIAEFELTPGEARLLEAAARGVDREVLAEHLGLAESTIKTHVRSLVAKCDVPQLHDAARLIWERASRSKS